jgi:hypothetical protein
VVPLSILQLFTWQQLETLVAGKADIDVEYLKEHTDYRGYTASSPTVQYFWAMFEAWSDEERSKFIRFVWGRSRLPARGQVCEFTRARAAAVALPTDHATHSPELQLLMLSACCYFCCFPPKLSPA